MRNGKSKQHIYNNSVAVEEQYQQELKAEQSIFQMVFSSFTQCYWVPFSPYQFPLFLQTDFFVKQPQDKANRDTLKNKKPNNCG